jgi:hypothetical protein
MHTMAMVRTVDEPITGTTPLARGTAPGKGEINPVAAAVVATAWDKEALAGDSNKTASNPAESGKPR